jgi:hypothetical protein
VRSEISLYLHWVGKPDDAKLCKFAIARPAAGIFVANDIETRLSPSENEASAPEGN